MRKLIRISGKRTRKIVFRKVMNSNGEMAEMIKLLKKDNNLNPETDKEDFSYIFNEYFIDGQRYF